MNEDLCDAKEARILEKVKIDFRYEMDSMKNEIMMAIAGVPWHVGIEYGYDEFSEDFEVAGSSGEDRNNHVERSMEGKVG